jgi:hypothetical protein
MGPKGSLPCSQEPKEQRNNTFLVKVVKNVTDIQKHYNRFVDIKEYVEHSFALVKRLEEGREDVTDDKQSSYLTTSRTDTNMENLFKW